MERRAIYPGSFDPPTLGHLDIIERAAGLFDELIVAVGRNRSKDGYLPFETRVECLSQCSEALGNVRVVEINGLLAHFAEENNCRILVRGLRAVSDFDYEFRIAMANRKLREDLETVFLITRDEYSFISSSVVKEIAELGGDISGFVPEIVERAMVAHRKIDPREKA